MVFTMASKKIKVDTSQFPYVENYPPLRDWLKKHEARCMWQLPMQPEHGREEPPTAYVEQWMFPKTSRMVVVVVYANKMGWDVFTSSNEHQIDATLEDAEERLGLS